MYIYIYVCDGKMTDDPGFRWIFQQAMLEYGRTARRLGTETVFKLMWIIRLNAALSGSHLTIQDLWPSFSAGACVGAGNPLWEYFRRNCSNKRMSSYIPLYIYIYIMYIYVDIHLELHVCIYIYICICSHLSIVTIYIL